MSRRIIPVLCALALAVPAAAVAQPADNSPAVQSVPVAYGGPAVQSGPVGYGDTKYDLQNQQDLNAATAVRAYEQAISGDTQGNLPRAIAPTNEKPATPVTPASTPTASHDDTTNGWQIAALVQAALLAACALGAAVVLSGRTRSRRLGT